MNTCLVLIAHGSKNPNWLAPFQQLAHDLKQEAGEGRVHLCFMEQAKPSLHELAPQIVQEGTRRVRLLPLFLARGSHLREDIPAQVEAVKSQFPGLEIELLPPLSEHPQFAELLRIVARQYVSPTEKPDV